jgi:signal transduction histidine kinase
MLTKKRYISVKVNDLKLRERNRDLSILLEMSNLIPTSLDLRGLLAGALSKVLEYFDMDAGRIYLMDEEGRHLYLVSHQGIEPKGLEKLTLDEGFSGKAARTKSFIAQHVSELEDRERVHLLVSKGLKIIICVPLVNMDQVEGVMNLGTRKMIRLDQRKIDLLTAIGNQIAVAANNVRLYEELQSKIKNLNEKKDMIKFFAYSISHDLKSPAIGIYGLSRRLQEKYAPNLDEKGKTYCTQILKAAAQMVDLVEKINAYIISKEARSHFERIKIGEITEEIRTEFSSRLKERKIRWTEPDSLPEIIADRLALSRVFRNFVDNALKYGGEDMLELKIGYEEDEAYHIFSFSDDGIGIKPRAKEMIFEQFQRDDTSHSTAGSGLGLAIVKEIAGVHRGKAWVVNNDNKGATFYISLAKDLKIAD